MLLLALPPTKAQPLQKELPTSNPFWPVPTRTPQQPAPLRTMEPKAKARLPFQGTPRLRVECTVVLVGAKTAVKFTDIRLKPDRWRHICGHCRDAFALRSAAERYW